MAPSSWTFSLLVTDSVTLALQHDLHDEAIAAEGLKASCLVYERAEESLKEQMSRRKLMDLQAKMCLQQVVAALSHLHARNVVHCDIKPANVCRFQVRMPATSAFARFG